jgi:hypothetical protein
MTIGNPHFYIIFIIKLFISIIAFLTNVCHHHHHHLSRTSASYYHFLALSMVRRRKRRMEGGGGLWVNMLD